MKLKWFVQHEPVILGGVLSGIGVFFGVRYGSHSTAALQGSLGLGSASFVSFLSRFVGPSAVSDVEGIANDLASLKEQIGPLPPKGGVVSVIEWLAKTARTHAADLEATAEAAKADIADLLHQHVVSFDPPTTEAAPLTIAEPVQTLPEPEVTTPTPEANPLDATPTPELDSAMAELAKLVP